MQFPHWPLEKEIPPTPVLLPGKSHGQEPGRLQSMGSLRIWQAWSNLAAAAALITELFLRVQFPSVLFSCYDSFNFSLILLYQYILYNCCCSVIKPCSTVCNPMDCSRLLCPPLSSRVCSNSCPLSQWCYLTISSCSVPFSSCPQSFPASGSFPMSRFFASGGQSIVTTASPSVLPVNIQGWFPLGLVWPCILRDSQELSPAPQFESVNSLALSLLYDPTFTFIHDYWKNIPLTIWPLLAKRSLCFLIPCLYLMSIIAYGEAGTAAEANSIGRRKGKFHVWHFLRLHPMQFSYGIF